MKHFSEENENYKIFSFLIYLGTLCETPEELKTEGHTEKAAVITLKLKNAGFT